MPQPESSVERLSMALGPVLDLRAAGSLKDALQEGLGHEAPLALDAGAVTRMSTACVQVLTAFAIATQKAGIDLKLKSSSSVFDAAFVNLGLEDVLASMKGEH